MRIRCSKAFCLLTKFDWTSCITKIARDVISLSEKLKATYESLTFLQRWKRNYLLPDCVSHCFDMSLKIKNSASLDQFLTKSKRNLLSILIRSKYSEINDINRCLKEWKSKLSERTRTQLMPIISVAEKETQERSKRTAINKFNKLKSVQRTTRRNTPKVSCSTPDNCKTTDNTADRVTVIGDIQVPALQALANVPKFAISPHFSRENSNRQCKLKWLLWRMLWDGKVPTHCQHKISSPPLLPWPSRHYQRAPSTMTGKSHPVTTQWLKRRFKIYKRTSNGSLRDVMFT